MKLKKYIKSIRLLLLVGLVVSVSSCYKTDIDLISNDLVWSPNFSIPVGANVFMLKARDTINVKPGNFYTFPRIPRYDTLEFDLSDLFDIRDVIDSMVFRVNIMNEFPAQGEVFIFYPENGQQPSYSRSLTGDKPIEIAEGKIDAEGKVTIPAKKTLDIPVTSSQIDDLMTSHRLIIRTYVRNLYVTEAVKNNYMTYRFITQLGMQAQIVKAYE
jgi:hypothetical protein